MSKSNKHILSLLLVISLVWNLNAPIVEAHSTSQSQYNWGEDVGWSIDEYIHSGTTNITFMFAQDMNIVEKQMVNGAANKWSSKCTISAVSSSNNIIGGVYDNEATNIVAQFQCISTNSQGHLTKWNIVLNRYFAPSAVTIAHEFGHVIGLNDLYSNGNRSKLMFGYSDRTASNPTDYDYKGASVILGTHVSHTWGTPYSSVDLPSSLMKCNCNVCNILKIVPK